MSEEKEPYRGAKYKFPCTFIPSEHLLFQAGQASEEDDTVGLWVALGNERTEELVNIFIGPNHLNEFHAAVNAALAAVADNGIRLIDEEYEATFKRLYLNDVVEAPKPEPAPTLLSEVLKNAGAAFSAGPSLNDLFPNAASRAARDE